MLPYHFSFIVNLKKKMNIFHTNLYIRYNVFFNMRKIESNKSNSKKKNKIITKWV